MRLIWLLSISRLVSDRKPRNLSAPMLFLSEICPSHSKKTSFSHGYCINSSLSLSHYNIFWFLPAEYWVKAGATSYIFTWKESNLLCKLPLATLVPMSDWSWLVCAKPEGNHHYLAVQHVTDPSAVSVLSATSSRNYPFQKSLNYGGGKFESSSNEDEFGEIATNPWLRSHGDPMLDNHALLQYPSNYLFPLRTASEHAQRCMYNFPGVVLLNVPFFSFFFFFLCMLSLFLFSTLFKLKQKFLTKCQSFKVLSVHPVNWCVIKNSRLTKLASTIYNEKSSITF